MIEVAPPVGTGRGSTVWAYPSVFGGGMYRSK